MIRLRYEKTIFGTLNSKPVNTNNVHNDTLIVSIDSDGTFGISTSFGELLKMSTEPMPIATAKLQAKQELVKLGAKFESEVRPRLKKDNFKEVTNRLSKPENYDEQFKIAEDLMKDDE